MDEQPRSDDPAAPYPQDPAVAEPGPDTGEVVAGGDLHPGIEGQIQPPDRLPNGTVASRLQIRMESSGPLPHPSILKQYDAIQPGFAERIVAMAEREQTHRQTMEGRLLTEQVDADKRQGRLQERGQMFAFGIGVFALGIGGFLVSQGHDVAGGLLGSGGVAGLVAAFLHNRKGESEKGAAKPPAES